VAASAPTLLQGLEAGARDSLMLGGDVKQGFGSSKQNEGSLKAIQKQQHLSDPALPLKSHMSRSVGSASQFSHLTPTIVNNAPCICS
jgi:hypothetical protein